MKNELSVEIINGFVNFQPVTEPVAHTKPTDLKDEHETKTKEPVGPVTADLTDPQAEPETEKPVASVPLTPPFLFLNLHVYPTNMKAGPDDCRKVTEFGVLH